MRVAGRASVFASLALVACLAGSVATLRKLNRLRSRGSSQDVLFISSPKAIKRMSLGYSGLLADIYWTRTVQYFGRNHFVGADHYALLAPLLEITTSLDPHLSVAYDFGANFLAAKPPLGAGEPQRAIDLIKFGIRNNPTQWKLYRNLGFVYYLDLKDYANAAEAFADASKLPDAHPFMKIMAAQMAQHAGEISTARMLWVATYESTKDKDIRANASAHLRALKVDDDVTHLEELTALFRSKTGRPPSSYSELIAFGMLPGVPIDPLGNPYRLMADGKIEVRNPDNFPFIDKGVPSSYIPPAKPKFLPSDY
jgi:tetratricopeptide (TPR) repeat protein